MNTLYERRNKFTWVLKNDKKKPALSSVSEVVLEKPDEQKPVRKTDFYRSFCKRIFAERKFICKAELNQLIKDELQNNTTWYRNRMIQLGFLREECNVIKPGENL